MVKKYFPGILFFMLVVALYPRVGWTQYCIPEYLNNCSEGAYINKFTFNTISNTASGCNGNTNNYILYPAEGITTTAVELGGLYGLSVKSSKDDGIGIWIDYNNDGDFDDGGEFIFSSPFYDNVTFTGTVIIPNNNFCVGQRRLRVRGVLQTLLSEINSCGVFPDGETEDYIITINPAPPCDDMPAAGTITAFPSSICAEGNTSELHLNGYSVASSISIEWESSPDGINWNTISGATGDFYVTDPLYNNTNYRAKVTCSNSGQVAYSDDIQINVGEIKIFSVTHDSICGQGTATLQAFSNANTVSWYKSEVSAVPLYSSAAPFKFTAPITNTTTFYAAASSGILYLDSTGLKDNIQGSGSDDYQNNYLVFNITHACKLSGVHVYPSQEGNVIIQLRDQNFNPIRTDTFVVTAAQIGQKTFLELDYNLLTGNAFQLTLLDGSVPLWSNQSGVNFPYEIPNVLSLYTSNLGPNYYFYFYNWVVNYSDQCETPRTPVKAVLSNAPPVAITTGPSDATICSNTNDQVEINATPGYSSYTWTPDTGLSSGTGPHIIAKPDVTTTYTLLASDSICQSESVVTITVNNTPSVSITTPADSICGGTSAQLFANVSPLLNYTVEEVAFTPESGYGTQVPLEEDEVSEALPIGFTFKFYGNYYNTFKISANGFITFDSIAFDGCCSGQKLPDTFQPNNLIAFAWEDLSPQLGGTVSYFVTGAAPFRKLIVSFDSVPHYTLTGSSDPVTVQLQLCETTNMIEIHTLDMPGNPTTLWFNHTMGIENATGTLAAAVPGRNGNNDWTASEDAWRFSPIEYSYTWSPAGSLNDASSSNPVATPSNTTNYTVTVADTNTQCASSATIKIKVINKPVAGVIDPPFKAVCGEDFDTFNLSGYTSGASIQWMRSHVSGGPYSEITGATNASYITNTTDTNTYYIAKVSCTVPAITEEAVAEVLSVPDPPVGDTVYRCGAGNVDLEAPGSGGSIWWYDAPTGGNYLGQGSPFTTQPISQSTVFWAEEGPPLAAPLPTTFTGGSIADGNMFDITAVNTIVVTGFDGHLTMGQENDVEIYYRKGSYTGFENDAAAWTLLGSADDVIGQGIGVPTPYPFELDVIIPSGKTYSFYITSKAPGINCSNGSLEGNIFATDNNIGVAEGIAVTYPFDNTSSPVKWNGIIHYSTVGCYSERTPINAIVYYTQITASVTDPAICAGDSVMLTATNNGSGNYLYQWSPLLPSMNPPDGSGDTIVVTPSASVNLTLTATEINVGCDTTLTVPLSVIPLPVAFFTGLPDTVGINDAPYILSGNPGGGTFSGVGISGNIFDPLAAGIGGPYPVNYTYADPFGCSDDTTQEVVVVLDVGTFDLSTIASFAVFPNPSTGFFTLDIHLPGNTNEASLAIYDVYGRLHYKSYPGFSNGIIKQVIDASGWPKGNYFIEINTGEILRKKITLQ